MVATCVVADGYPEEQRFDRHLEWQLAQAFAVLPPYVAAAKHVGVFEQNMKEKVEADRDYAREGMQTAECPMKAVAVGE